MIQPFALGGAKEGSDCVSDGSCNAVPKATETTEEESRSNELD